MTEEDRAILALSDPELLLWYSLFRLDRLDRRQIKRLMRLMEEARSEHAPPRRMSPVEWQLREKQEARESRGAA